ncbi:hypothetical protein PLUTE_a1667 [Pseudoalteromonas luteoviolacea DSM 6061]|nr:hypothetical protein [Pseudoalteromonas luteoviolacea DSM 6061]
MKSLAEFIISEPQFNIESALKEQQSQLEAEGKEVEEGIL